MMEATFSTATSNDDFEAAKNLFHEYANFLGIDLSFQHFEEELENIRKEYNLPEGGLILCELANEIIGCAGVRKLDDQTAELKRMYIKPAYQHKGYGKHLLHYCLELAKRLGYQKIRLDTLPFLQAAIRVYQKAGFYLIPPYYFNPNPGVVYMEKIL